MDISAAHLRALRAAIFAALCVTLSTTSHVWLSRMPLPLTTVAALGVAVFTTAYALAGRERRFGQIAALMVPLELASDTVFSGGQHTCYGPGGGPVTGPLRSLGVHVLCGGGSVGASLPKLPAAHTAAGPGTWLALLAAHVVVALLAAAWLRRGEAALVRLVRAVAGFAFRPLLLGLAAVRLPAPGRAAARPARSRVPVPLPPQLAHCVVRRGPPLPAPAA